MLTKGKNFTNKTPIDLFHTTENSLLLVQRNVLKEVGVNGESIILETEHPIDRIIVKGTNVFVVDWYANTFAVGGANLPIILGGLGCIFPNGQMITHLLNPKRTAMLTSDGKSLWELNFRSLQFLHYGESLFFKDNSDRTNRKIVAVDSSTGREMWSLSSSDLDSQLTEGQQFGKLLAVHEDELYLTVYPEGTLCLLNKNNGERIREVKSGKHFEDLASLGLNYDFFLFDIAGKKLVHPQMELDIRNMELLPKYDLATHNESEREIHTIPTVFPFAFNKELTIFGLQRLRKDDPNFCLNEVVGIKRDSGKVIFREQVNKAKPDAGIKQIQLQSNKLFILDSYGTLSNYKVEL